MLGPAPVNEGNQRGGWIAPIGNQRHGRVAPIDNSDLQLGNDEEFARRFAALEHGLPDPIQNTTSLESQPRPDLGLPCSICLEQILDTVCFISDCGHSFCEPCIRKHITVVATEAKAYPILCPACREELDPQRCLSLLAGTGPAHEALEMLILEREHFSCIRYCANEECANPFDWIEDPQVRGFADEFKVTCPLCETATCVNCRVKWHENQTCDQFREENENSDALVRLVRQSDWRSCPSCGHVIERRLGDCNFVKCRCGCGFCYKCGIGYRSLVPIPHNQHGQPGCTCGLFGADYVPPQGHAGVLHAPIIAPLPQAPLINQAFADLHRYHQRAPVLPYFGQNDQGQNELENGCHGRNGYADILSWLSGRRMRRLPASMGHDLTDAVCPYNECKAEFPTIRALQQHLVDVQWHPVWLCCGRPFFTERGRQMHVDALHGGHVL